MQRFERHAEELEITGAKEVIAKWRTEGMTAGAAYACPRTSYEITPLCLKGKAMYNKWLEAEKKKKSRGSFEEEFLPDETTTAARSTSGRRSTTQPPPNYCIDVSDAGSSASVATKRMGSHGGSTAPTGEKAAKFAGGERVPVRSRRTPTPVGLSESELIFVDDRLV